MLTRQQIRQFLAVVETGSFTQAAQRIGVTQPSLSSGIRLLEEQVGATLFERQRPNVRLTAAANRLLPIARRIDREFKRAEIETAKSVQTTRAFTIGVIPTLPTGALTKIAGEFGPNVTLREKPMRELSGELRKGTVDAAIGIAEHAAFEGLYIQTLWEEAYKMMVPSNHRLAQRKAVSAQETADEVMIARRSCEFLADTSRFFTDFGVRPHFSFKSTNDQKVMELVRAGLGVTVAPQSLRSEGVEAVELTDFGAKRTIALLARADDYSAGGQYRETIDRIETLLQGTCQT